MIRQVKGGWKVFSESGKSLSRVYPSRSEAVRRLRQIEFWKHKNK